MISDAERDRIATQWTDREETKAAQRKRNYRDELLVRGVLAKQRSDRRRDMVVLRVRRPEPGWSRDIELTVLNVPIAIRRWGNPWTAVSIDFGYQAHPVLSIRLSKRRESEWGWDSAYYVYLPGGHVHFQTRRFPRRRNPVKKRGSDA